MDLKYIQILKVKKYVKKDKIQMFVIYNARLCY